MSDHALRAYDSILDMLSSVENPTPIVRLLHITPYKHTQVFAKLEWYNPFGAVKDRVAANLVRDAEERGEKLEHLVEQAGHRVREFIVNGEVRFGCVTP